MSKYTRTVYLFHNNKTNNKQLVLCHLSTIPLAKFHLSGATPNIVINNGIDTSNSDYKSYLLYLPALFYIIYATKRRRKEKIRKNIDEKDSKFSSIMKKLSEMDKQLKELQEQKQPWRNPRGQPNGKRYNPNKWNRSKGHNNQKETNTTKKQSEI